MGGEFTISPFLGVEAVTCGPLDIHWLRPSVRLSEDELARGVHADELVHAGSLKAAARRSEYLRSRYLLRRLTGCTAPLPRTPLGGPTWPPGLVGSLTHKDGYVGLALAPASAWRSVGVDAEDLTQVKSEFEPRICNPSDARHLDHLARTTGLPRVAWLALVFSIKEALFKCHHPLGGRLFYFHDAELTEIDAERRRARARVLVPTSSETPAGFESEAHFTWWHDAQRRFILTTVTLPHQACPP